MDNALFYTFSTIPQMAGAMFGILAAFVLYRFQSDANARPGDLQELWELLDNSGRPDGTHSPRQRGMVALAEDRDADFLSLIDAAGVPPLWSRQFQSYKRFKWTAKSRKMVRKALWAGFLATALLIVYSLLVLCFTPWIVHTRVAGFSYTLLALGMFGVYLVLQLYWGLLTLMLDP